MTVVVNDKKQNKMQPINYQVYIMSWKEKLAAHGTVRVSIPGLTRKVTPLF